MASRIVLCALVVTLFPSIYCNGYEKSEEVSESSWNRFLPNALKEYFASLVVWGEDTEEFVEKLESSPQMQQEIPPLPYSYMFSGPPTLSPTLMQPYPPKGPPPPPPKWPKEPPPPPKWPKGPPPKWPPLQNSRKLREHSFTNDLDNHASTERLNLNDVDDVITITVTELVPSWDPSKGPPIDITKPLPPTNPKQPPKIAPPSTEPKKDPNKHLPPSSHLPVEPKKVPKEEPQTEPAKFPSFDHIDPKTDPKTPNKPKHSPKHGPPTKSSPKKEPKKFPPRPPLRKPKHKLPPKQPKNPPDN